MRCAQALLAVALCVAAAARAGERHPEVLIVVNGDSEISRAIGRYYAARRGVPEDHVVALDLPLKDATLTSPRHETISRQEFDRRVRAPIAAYLSGHDLVDRIRILVTTKGVPLRIAEGARNRSYAERTSASVDAELALLFSGAIGSAGTAGSANPYFARDEPFESWRRAHPKAPLRYLVARLTGYQTDVDPETGVPRDVKHLIDAATAKSDAPGLYLIDEDPTQRPLVREGNTVLLAPTSAALRALGRRVEDDREPAMISDRNGIAGYASWGSNDHHSPPPPFYGAVAGRLVPGRFAARAVSVDLVSSNARSFCYPTRYGQSLLADLIHMGIAGAAGHVFEPMLVGVARPYLLLAAYVRGAPAAEAYFRSVPYLGWTNVYVGDPLMQVAQPAPATKDRDGDGVPDATDDCLWIPNPDQRDTDKDGYGNLCDPDFDGDGRVTSELPGGFSDLQRLERSLATGLYVPDFDLDGDGRVDQHDLGIAELYLSLPPGPSGRVGSAVGAAGGVGQADSPRSR